MAARVELVPTLTRCIQATAKRAFSTELDLYLQRDEEDCDLGERIEILRLFLESADFTALRRESERHLVEGKTARFTLYLEAGELRCEIEVE